MKALWFAASAIAAANAAPGSAQMQVQAQTGRPAAPAGAVPLGKLPAQARPVAYRIEVTVLPESQGFSGHTEIDVDVVKPTRSLYLHGLGLAVQKATVGGRPARWSEVDASGVVRLDFDAVLPAGRTTLAFDYTAPFMTGSEGLYQEGRRRLVRLDADGGDRRAAHVPRLRRARVQDAVHDRHHHARRDLKAFANTPRGAHHPRRRRPRPPRVRRVEAAADLSGRDRGRRFRRGRGTGTGERRAHRRAPLSRDRHQGAESASRHRRGGGAEDPGAARGIPASRTLTRSSTRSPRR
ncbi:hypothetical protein AB5I41_16795 [Sphingomonas sp. MMS24-JH45]